MMIPVNHLDDNLPLYRAISCLSFGLWAPEKKEKNKNKVELVVKKTRVEKH